MCASGGGKIGKFRGGREEPPVVRPSAIADVADDLCTQPIWVQFVCIVHPEDKLKELLA